MKSIRKLGLAASLAALIGCGGGAEEGIQTGPSTYEPILLGQEVTPTTNAKAAALSAAEVNDMLSDLSAFLTTAFPLTRYNGSVQPNGNFQSSLSFQGPADCTFNQSFGGGKVSLEHDCTMPSGRHVSGSLNLDFGLVCSPFGFDLEYHLLVESQPGAGDVVVMDGRTKLGFDRTRFSFSNTFLHRWQQGRHTIENSVAGCFILDSLNRVMAMDGHVSTAIDGTVIRDARIEDLQTRLCEGLPHQGRVSFRDEYTSTEVIFGRDTPETAVVTVNTNNVSSEVKLPIGPLVRHCADFWPSTPITVDYADCGGCGQPAPPAGSTPPPPTTGSGGGGSSGGGGPDL